MDFEIRFKSISSKWYLRVLLPITVVIIAAGIFASTFVRSYYISQVQNTAEEYASGFLVLAGTDSEFFYSSAKEYCEQFEYKDKVEVMVIDNTGHIIVSTSGFTRDGLKMPDYFAAMSGSSGTATWAGKSSAGESVLAGTTVLRDYGSGSNGAVRYVVSMKYCYNHIRNIIFFISLLCLSVIAFCFTAGMFFINSIIRPVRAVSVAARKIAAGDYKEQLPIGRSDEIGELCDSINYMEAELKNSEKLKNDFISSVSHELRTPLTAIRGWAETAKMSVGNDDELVERGLDVVLSESGRLAELVEDLLDFSRMQVGRFNFNMQPMSVCDVLSQAVDMYIELAAKQEIEVIFNKPKEDAIVNADKNRIKQVFVNIIDNAVKYTGEKGQVLIQQLMDDGCVRIVVKDTGVGIPAADLDHVKEKFYKANKEVRGSGIGLAVADEIIKEHKGLLFIESTEGLGTTVTVVLPVVINEEPPQADAIS